MKTGSKAASLRFALAETIEPRVREYIEAVEAETLAEIEALRELMRARDKARELEFATFKHDVANALRETERLLAVPTTVRKLKKAIDLLEAHDGSHEG